MLLPQHTHQRGLTGGRQRSSCLLRLPRSTPHVSKQHIAKPSTFAHAATGTEAISFPTELPIFPVMPVGVFLPGMTRTLHLYEDHFLAMLKHAQELSGGWVALVVVEPFTGQVASDGLPPGCLVGGHNQLYSCACLVKILNVKEMKTQPGTLVRLRGEARLSLKSLTQVEPFAVGEVGLIEDTPPTDGQDDLLQLTHELEEVMRAAQNLAAKFRCEETACIQQAMRWVEMDPLQAPPPSEDPSLHRTARLSFAALQYLPQSDAEDRWRVLRARLLAMEERDVGSRLREARAAMAACVATLSARCALMTL